MRIVSVGFFPLAIPFVDEFAHSIKTRSVSDALLLRIETSTGIIGWGETLVRPYVTGETSESVEAGLRAVLQQVENTEWRLGPVSVNPASCLQYISSALDNILAPLEKNRPAHIISWNGLRCLIEIAIIDALLKERDWHLSMILPPKRREVIYSGVISGGSIEKSLRMTRHFKQLGIQFFKLKVNGGTTADINLVRGVRELIGPNSSLRLDANMAFTNSYDAIEFACSIEPFGIDAIEQPFSRGDLAEWTKLQAATSIAIMPDESLITVEDAHAIINAKAAGLFNLRLAKCGGIMNTLQLAELANQSHIAVQIGCLVGETSILSAVGRAIAAYIDPCEFVEGSYGTLLLKEDIGLQSVRFGFGGKAPLLKGIGHGVVVNESVVQKYSVGEW